MSGAKSPTQPDGTIDDNLRVAVVRLWLLGYRQRGIASRLKLHGVKLTRVAIDRVLDHHMTNHVAPAPAGADRVRQIDKANQLLGWPPKTQKVAPVPQKVAPVG